MVDARLHPVRGGLSKSPGNELLSSVRARLVGLALVTIVGAVAYQALGSLVLLGGQEIGATVRGVMVERAVSSGAMIALALLVILFSRQAEDTGRLETLGVALLLGFAALSGYARYDVVHMTSLGLGGGWSGVSVLIILLPVLMPITSSAAVRAGIAATALDVGAYSLNAGLGTEGLPAAQEYLLGFRGDVIAVGVAWAVAKIVDDLRVKLHDARKLGSYELLERIGVGGMGEVWRGRHGLLARPAAIKLIKPESLANLGEFGRDMMVTRFEREAQATALLECPHTIDVYDFGVAADGTLYYAMELLEGIDLHEVVIAHGRMPPARVVYLLLQMCESLAEAHARGLIHRDIKPSNLFLCRYGGRHDFIKVLDFGLVKLVDLDGGDAAQLTGDGVAGTPAFLPPEQGIKGRDIDARSDIYALGCVGYWLLTDHFVFEATTAAEYIVQHVREAPVAPSARFGITVPPALEALIMQALAKDPDARPQSAEAFAEALLATGLGDGWTEAAAIRWWAAHEAGTSIGAAYGAHEVAATEVLSDPPDPSDPSDPGVPSTELLE